MLNYKFSLQLTSGFDEIELFAAHETILRALVIAKLCDSPESDRIIDSSTVKSIADSLTQDMDNLGDKIGIRPNGSQRRFLTVSASTDPSYIVLLNRVCHERHSHIREYLSLARDDQAIEYIGCLFSPFIINSVLAMQFKTDVSNLK